MVTLPNGLKFCRENPFKAHMTLSRYQEILCDVFGTENITKRKYTEKYSGIKLVLYYYKGEHIGTYNRDSKTSISFYE